MSERDPYPFCHLVQPFRGSRSQSSRQKSAIANYRTRRIQQLSAAKLTSEHNMAPMPKTFNSKQGQYLAFIYHYTKVHRRPPAESDIQYFFRTSPPSVHQMILRLEEKQLLRRVPGQARSLEVLVPVEKLPLLE
jgi:DNA-binding MarR family transcriptional regulator